MSGWAIAAVAPARASGTAVASTPLGAAVAVSVLAAGAGLVGAGLAWAPRGDAQAVARGGRIYAAECAICHGARLEGGPAPARPGAPGPLAPPLGATGHAWRHPDAQLAAAVARGTEGAAPAGVPRVTMPAFADRLGPDGIDAVLAYVKSHWPAGIRARQAALNGDTADTLAALSRDPAWTFPARCLSPPAAADES